jgi:hypothetical protein
VPRSPLLGGGLLGGGFGVAIDNNQNAWFSNFGWGATIYQPAEGSVSVFSPDGKPISPPEGFIGSTDVRTDRVQDIAIDPDNNVWLASYEYGQVVVFPDGNQDNAFAASIPDGSKPFGIAISEDGSAWVTSSKDLWAYSEGRLSKFQIEDGQLNCVYSAQLGRGLKGLAIDSGGNIWVPSGGDDALYLFNSDGVELGLFMARGGINGPWGIAVDGNDNIWVSNFGKMLPNDVYSNAAISQLAGANQNTRPRSDGFATGQEITPETGYTLPTGGAQVRLRNGDPLYGQGAEPCCSPLMRMTNVVIDRAGNVWAVNNWKPDFDNDAAPTTGNPGGDGIVIFVGLAKPPAN